ncbi:hypothetical protein [Streptococcus cuniculi]|uniref:DUF1310 family protein n=1 Tax=Streptococcus cuniculi TaxID=1432788 RepID=A0A4Y9JAD3_9STRE|nr:hypothetical protein [Streptococcus cuniculi]MBF0778871.1 hypothetical protein [Streptococcus cuniculi]TFU97148.1 hypothetical protein E4T82_09095 [Streptococcus cuniculi]
MKRKALILLFILGGIIMAFSINGQMQKAAEEKRNREYEVSLVKALKNSYEGITEIKLSNPRYTMKPRIWSCSVVLSFADQEEISYGINHDLGDTVNYGGVMKGGTDIQINQQWESLHRHEGVTSTKIEVTYSNGEREIQ